MKPARQAPVETGKQAGPSRTVVIVVLVPTLALLACLTVWAYQVSDWTWFGLLIAASLGLLVFAVAPNLFSIRGSSEPASHDWCLTMEQPSQFPDKNVRTIAASERTSAAETNAPHRTA